MIYFARSGDLIKIGKSDNPKARLKSLSTGASLTIELLATWEISDAAESRLHEAFRADRSHGEWFRATEKLLALVSAVKAGKPDEEIVAVLWFVTLWDLLDLKSKRRPRSVHRTGKREKHKSVREQIKDEKDERLRADLDERDRLRELRASWNLPAVNPRASWWKSKECFVCGKQIEDKPQAAVFHAQLMLRVHLDGCSRHVDLEYRDYTTSPRGRWRARRDVLASLRKLK